MVVPYALLPPDASATTQSLQLVQSGPWPLVLRHTNNTESEGCRDRHLMWVADTWKTTPAKSDRRVGDARFMLVKLLVRERARGL